MSRSPTISRIPSKPLTITDRIRYLMAAAPKVVAAPVVKATPVKTVKTFGKRNRLWA